MDIGISSQDREAIAAGLSKLLADTYTLYLKTHYFHWNVTGPMFNMLHLMFEAQYTELVLAVDTVAERIQSLDIYAPGTYSQFAKLTSIEEANGVGDIHAEGVICTAQKYQFLFSGCKAHFT